MNIFHHKRKKYRFLCLAISAFIVLLIGIIPVRIAIAFSQTPIPQAIFTLGGGPNREKFTAQFAQNHPTLEIWVSSGTRPDIARKIFREARISDERVNLDRRAVDTVTNFTSLVADFKSRNIQHVYLVTSDFHMRRAIAIATIVFGSQGIAFTPVSIPTKNPPETWLHILRDFSRAILWLFTGRTGASARTLIHLLASDRSLV
ncbi:YdcF family protein [Cyanobacteria bacterium FACHB-472]|nr:YdcF family protein [Cyanobacteria bacterium FACHB-472]